VTKGNWKDNYGGEGFNTVNDSMSYPSYAQVNVSGYASPTWAASTTDTRALQKQSANDRIAARWESSGSSFFTIDLNITDGQSHQVAFYGLDWEGNNRSQRVDIMDWATNILLDSESISQFNGGKYLVWNVKGHVRITVNKTGARTAVVSGLYFGSAAGVPTPTPTPTPTPSPTPTPTPAPLTVALTSPSNNTTFSLGTDVTVTASATDTTGTVTGVQFYAGSQLIGTSNVAPFNVVWSNIAAGSYSLTATAVDNHSITVTSTPITVKISKSLKGVRNNRQNTTNLVNATFPGDAQASTASLASLLTDLEQTYNDFNTERSMFDSASPINKYLLAAVLLARSSAALGSQNLTSGVTDRLDKLDAYLGFCEDLMVSDSISQQSLTEANQFNARSNLLIAQPITNPLSRAGFKIYPNEGAEIDTTPASPFSTQSGFVANGATSYELAGVSVTIGGQPAPLLLVSPTQIAFIVPSGLPAGMEDVVVTSREGYILNGIAAVAGLNPVILGRLGDSGGAAAALDAVGYQSGAFSTVGSGFFGPDTRTRVSIWASGISTGVTNTDTSNDIIIGFGQIRENLAEWVTVEARTSDGSLYFLPVEFAGAQGTLVGLDQVNVVLVPELRGAGAVQLTIIAAGVRSNTMTITVQ